MVSSPFCDWLHPTTIHLLPLGFSGTPGHPHPAEPGVIAGALEESDVKVTLTEFFQAIPMLGWMAPEGIHDECIWGFPSCGYP